MTAALAGELGWASRICTRVLVEAFALLAAATPHVTRYGKFAGVSTLFLPYASAREFGRYAPDAEPDLDLVPHPPPNVEAAPTYYIRMMRAEIKRLRSKRSSWRPRYARSSMAASTSLWMIFAACSNRRFVTD